MPKKDKAKGPASKDAPPAPKKGVKLPPPPPPPPPPPKPTLVEHQPESLPGLLKKPRKSIIISQSGKYEEFFQSLACGFTKCQCVLLVTPWAHYAIYNEFNGANFIYYVYDACSCTMNIIRHLDLQKGTAGLLYFKDLHHVIEYVLNNRFKCEKYDLLPKSNAIDKVCYEFCAKGGPDLYKVCNRRGEVLDFYEYAVKECKLQEMLKECPKIMAKCSQMPKPKKRQSEMGDIEEPNDEEKDCFKTIEMANRQTGP